MNYKVVGGKQNGQCDFLKCFNELQKYIVQEYYAHLYLLLYSLVLDEMPLSCNLVCLLYRSCFNTHQAVKVISRCKPCVSPQGAVEINCARSSCIRIFLLLLYISFIVYNSIYFINIILQIHQRIFARVSPL